MITAPTGGAEDENLRSGSGTGNSSQSNGFSAPRVGVEPTSLILIQSQAGPADRPTGDCAELAGGRGRPGPHRVHRPPAGQAPAYACRWGARIPRLASGA